MMLQQEPLPRAAMGRPILGVSAAMQEVFRLIERVGPTEASVLLTGESGSGKELAAQLHPRPQPAARGAVPRHQLRRHPRRPDRGRTVRLREGQLHRRGARPRRRVRARARRHAAARRSHRDAARHADAAAAGARDRASSTASARTSNSPTTCASSPRRNRCPLQAVQGGQLREDLLYRLAVFPIELPPLRNRGNDVELLAEHFLEELNAQARHPQAFSSALARMTLKQHTWPGNVRELQELHRARLHPGRSPCSNSRR